MSLKLRLTLVYGLVTAVTIAVLGLTLYTVAYNDLQSEVDRRLEVRAEQVQASLFPGTRPQSAEGLTSVDMKPLSAVGASGIFVEVRNTAGDVISGSPNLEGLPLPVTPAQLNESAQEGRRSISDDFAFAGQPVRVLTSPILARGTSGPVVGILAVGQSRQTISDTMEELQVILIVLGAISIVLCTGIGFAAAHQGLGPLRSFAKEAAVRASLRDFATPLKVSPGQDEVAHLGMTINQLLSTVDDTLRTHREFLADTSHELRNPLLALRTNIELMPRIPDEEGRAECQRESLEQIERLSRLVSELLVLAQIEIGLVIEKSPVNLARLLEQVVLNFQKIAPERNLSLIIREELTVLGDETRLMQVLTNLIDNALKYTPEDGKIIVSLYREDDSADISVRDNGEGISPTHLPMIFSRFYRVQKAGPRATQGTGLGLSIVKHLVEAHGGRVEVKSTPDIGSTFTVILPIAEQPSTPPAAQEAHQNSRFAAERAGSRAR